MKRKGHCGDLSFYKRTCFLGRTAQKPNKNTTWGRGQVRKGSGVFAGRRRPLPPHLGCRRHRSRRAVCHGSSCGEYVYATWLRLQLQALESCSRMDWRPALWVTHYTHSKCFSFQTTLNWLLVIISFEESTLIF